MSRVEKARKVDLISLLKKAGYTFSRETQTRAMYLSPFREESVPSFVVYKKSNTWYDWGTGESGDGIDFVINLLSFTFKETLDWILEGDPMPDHDYKPRKDLKRDGIDILNVSDITSQHLISYAKLRGVNEKVLKQYCFQVEYSYPSWDHITHISIGFQNIKGGWELRNASQKVSNSPKSWSMIRGYNNQDEAMIFEGFFDYLSYLSHNGFMDTRVNTYILNSTVFIPMLVDELSDYKSIELYLDNDVAAQDKIDQYLTGNRYIDMRSEYKEFNDYNDYVINLNN